MNSLYLNRVIELAKRRSLTCYDATYLDLAIQLSLPIATLDKALKLAARGEGIQIF